MIHFVVPAAHDGMIREYLDFWGRDVAARFRVVHTESLPSLERYSPGTYVLAALDQLSPGMAAFVTALHADFASRADVRFLNHPTRTWRRPQLLDQLHRRGYNAFRAAPISVDLESLRYPVFLRDWRSHDGALSPLLHRPAEVDAAIGRILLQGRSAAELLIIEFCDTADANGYYRKYAAFVVDGRVLPRTLSYSRDWMLKFQGSEFSRAMVEEELDYVRTNPHGETLREIFALAGVDYGRIDYAMKDGRIQTWEINLNPTVGRGRRPPSGNIPPELDQMRELVKQHFYRGFREAWESVDLEAADAATIEAQVSEPIRRAALAEVNGDSRGSGSSGNDWLAAMRRLLRPVKPLVAPMVAPALPYLGRVARRRTLNTQQSASRADGE